MTVTKRNKSKSSVKSWTNGVRPLTDLVPYKKNPRAHTEEDTIALADAIKRFGFTAPILVDKKNRILAGHNRCLAAAKLGIKTVPVRIIGDDWTAAEKSAYTIWDNQSTIRGTWDLDLLKAELIELKAEDVDLSILGFSLDDLALYTADEPIGADPEEVPEPPKNPVSRLGDMWIMGGHRLICGDSTKPEDVAKVLGKDKPSLLISDPPYGVDFDPTWRQGSENRTYMGDKPDKEYVWKKVWELFQGDVIYIWHASARLKDLWIALEMLGFDLRQLIVWNKMRFIIGRGDYSYNHECCFYGVRKGKRSNWQGARNQPTVWDIVHQSSDTNHGAQKPIECMKRPIENNSKRCDYVYDPFSGSGTTIISAEMTGRRCLAVEIAPEYVDVGVIRWQTVSGKEAVLAATGQTFAQVAAERTKKRPPKKGAKKSKPREAKSVRLPRSRSSGSTPRASSPSAT